MWASIKYWRNFKQQKCELLEECWETHGQRRRQMLWYWELQIIHQNYMEKTKEMYTMCKNTRQESQRRTEKKYVESVNIWATKSSKSNNNFIKKWNESVVGVMITVCQTRHQSHNDKSRCIMMNKSFIHERTNKCL